MTATIKIVNCGAPPRGWQVEYGLQIGESITAKSQGTAATLMDKIAMALLNTGAEGFTDERGTYIKADDYLARVDRLLQYHHGPGVTCRSWKRGGQEAS